MIQLLDYSKDNREIMQLGSLHKSYYFLIIDLTFTFKVSLRIKYKNAAHNLKINIISNIFIK